MPKKALRLFRLPMHSGKNLGGGTYVAVVAWIKFENPGVLPPFPTWEGLLVTETSDPRMTDGVDFPYG